MKKSCKKILSLIIAVALLTFSVVPALASGNDPTTWTLTTEDARPTLKTITVNGVYDSYVTIRAYQIVKGTYKDGKLTGYELCDSTNAPLADITKPTSTEIAAIANYIQTATRNNTLTLDYVKMRYQPYPTDGFTADVEAGEYIVLVTTSGDYVYNPAIVSVKVTDANLLSSASGGAVDMETQFSAGDTAYMKKNEVTRIKKEVVVDDNMVYCNIASYGKSVNFKLYNMTIPSYSEDYANPLIFKIIDDLNPDALTNSPFLGVSGLTVKVGTSSYDSNWDYIFTGDEVPEVRVEGADEVRNYTVTYYKKNESTTGDRLIKTTDPSKAIYYEIEFADAFIRANGTKDVEVTYSSTLTPNAKLALQNYSSLFVPNKTQATLQYSNDPIDVNSYYTCNNADSTTYTYTFGIDAVGDGIQTYEFNKVTQAGGTYQSVEDANSGEEITKKSQYALAGATFTIYSDRAMTEVITDVGTNGTAISDANGHIEFRGLGEGTYYLKETAAPTSPKAYTLNENNYKIVISAGDIGYSGLYFPSSYSITTYLMGDTDTEIGSATYTRSWDSSTSSYHIEPSVDPVEVVNTELVSLPTTGGVGTIIIAIVAGVGMAIFLTIFVISKKKRAKKG